eukprot:270071-Chlamydomonas_euryale.AAC.3
MDARLAVAQVTHCPAYWYWYCYTGFPGRRDFHIFCRQITSLQREPLARPRPGSTALPCYRVAH